MPTLTFTSGNDSYTVDAVETYDLTFLAGDDTLRLHRAGATTDADMGDGADVVFHKAGTASVLGGLGADRFEVYTSGLTADGGAGNDLFNIRGGTGLSLAGGLGDDRFNFYAASAGIQLHGGDGADDFFGYYWSSSGSVHGDAGNDYFVQFRDGISLFGGTGNDVYRADPTDPATFVELAGEGTDSVQVARGSFYTLPDNIENITVQGFSGSTDSAGVLTGNASNNTINGHANREIILGLAGNDRLFGKGGDDDLWGDAGNDYLDGGDGIDYMNGGEGNDTLNGRAGVDNMRGGAGDDTYYTTAHEVDSIVENAGEGIDTVRFSGGFYTYFLPENVENAIISSDATTITLVGNGGANTLTGNSSSDYLYGGGGDDMLKGGAGADYLGGQSGSDTLIGGIGADLMEGGTQNDFYYLDNSGDVVIEHLNEGFDAAYIGFTAAYYELPDNLEAATLQAGFNTALHGNDIGNLLTGNSGANTLLGYGGLDTLRGEGGNDTMWGGSDEDYMLGGSGNDFMAGGPDSDYLEGGSGNDTFYWEYSWDSVGNDRDTIADFTSLSGEGADDQLDLSEIDANLFVEGNQAFVLNTSYEPLGVAGDLWFSVPISRPDGTYNTIIYGDVNGDSIADFELLIQTPTANFWFDDITL